MGAVKFHSGKEGQQIAFINEGHDSQAAGLFWLGGFMSDMEGTKVESLAQWARENNRPLMRFDYSGHGRSGGNFRDGTISRWLGEAVEMFKIAGPQKRIVIGSSMGGWLALLLYRYLAEHDPAAWEKFAAMILIAPATDMTGRLMWDKYSERIRNIINKEGFYAQPSEYGDEPYIITRQLIEDGKKHFLLDDGLEVKIPVHILQGEKDIDVPWQHGFETCQKLHGKDIVFCLVKGADHRMSSSRDITRLLAVCDELCRHVEAGQ